MADRAKRKAKQRLKREKKRQAHRRQEAISPYKKAAMGELLACYVNSDWRERGQAAVFVLRRAPGVGQAVATFMIDLWCAGLKDAWGHVEVYREEFDKSVARMSERMDGTMAPARLEEVRGLVAGAVRFAVRNGFRLPPHWQRWGGFVGVTRPADWQAADLTGFGVEGGTKLRWVAPMFDLERRLIGSTVQEFLNRPDVEFIVGLGDESDWSEPMEAEDDEEFEDDEWDQEDGDDDEDAEDADEDDPVVDLEPRFEAMCHSFADQVRQWCFENGLVPSPKLNLAVGFTLVELLNAHAIESGLGSGSLEAARQSIDRMLQTMPEENRAAIEEGRRQVQQYRTGFDSPQALLRAVVGGALPSLAPENPARTP